MKGNHNHLVFLDTTLHVDALTNSSKLPLHKHLKRLYFQNSHNYNLTTSLSPTLDNMIFVTDVMAYLKLGKLSEFSDPNTVLVSVENWWYSY